MSFGPNHYVPILKVKRGEKASLQLLAPHIISMITPILEIVERIESKAPTVDSHLNTSFKNLAESVRPYSRCFLDVRELEPDGSSAAEEVFQRSVDAGMVFVPVTGVSRTVDVNAAMAHRTHGLAIRLTRSEFESGGMPRAIDRFLAKHALVPEQIDLIVDLGAVDQMISFGVMSLATSFLADIPHQVRWKTLTISSCAFPNSMGGVARHAHALVERADWIAWREGLYDQRGAIPRLPTFSDCAIQHPKGIEGFDPITMQVSASVRYTLTDDWLLIKGESTRRTPPSTQFPDLARKIVYGQLNSHFAGAQHCTGCSCVKNSADGAKKLGSAEAWRRIGTIHHMTCVIEQLKALSWP